MLKKKVAVIVSVIVVSAGLGFGIFKADASHADPKLNHDEVIKLVSEQYPGDVTEIELEKDHNRVVYEIEIRDGHSEYELKVDGNTGEIMKLKEKFINHKQDAQEKIGRAHV